MGRGPARSPGRRVRDTPLSCWPSLPPGGWSGARGADTPSSCPAPQRPPCTAGSRSQCPFSPHRSLRSLQGLRSHWLQGPPPGGFQTFLTSSACALGLPGGPRHLSKPARSPGHPRAHTPSPSPAFPELPGDHSCGQRLLAPGAAPWALLVAMWAAVSASLLASFQAGRSCPCGGLQPEHRLHPCSPQELPSRKPSARAGASVQDERVLVGRRGVWSSHGTAPGPPLAAASAGHPSPWDCGGSCGDQLGGWPGVADGQQR